MSRTIRIPFPDVTWYEKTRLVAESGSTALTVPSGSDTIYLRNTAGINVNDFIILDAFESEDAEIVEVSAIDREEHMVDLASETMQEHAIGVVVMKSPYNKVKVYKGLSVDISTHTTEVTTIGGVVLRPDNPYTVVIDSAGISTDYYSYKFMNDAVASVVVGTDIKNYNCKLSHVAAAGNRPINGPTWATYWEECSTAGSTWVSGTSYIGVTYGTQTLYTESDYDAILTVDQLKNWFMFGLDLTDDSGYPFPNSMYVFAIKSAVDSLEKTLGIKIKPTTILEEVQDYNAADYRDFAFLQLNYWPLISVEGIRVQYPTSDSPVVFPIEWVQMQRQHGQIHLIPTQGSLSTILMGRGGDYLNFVWRGYDFMPNLWRIDYTAGFAAGQCPNDIIGVVGMLACFYPLNIAGDLVGGIAVASKSIGIDGLSQSLNTTSSPENAGYSARLRQYERQMKIDIPKLKQYYAGIRFIAA